MNKQKLEKEISKLVDISIGNFKSLINLLSQDNPIWLPFADADHPEQMTPQIMTYLSLAQEVYYGGSAGGGKTDLLIGLAMTAHRVSRIFRRQYTQLESIVDRINELIDPRIDNFIKSPHHSLLTRDGRYVRLNAIEHDKDVKNYYGRANDFMGFDELPQFKKDHYKTVTIWNRTKYKDQFCNVVSTGNPPMEESEEWIIDYWAPWLDEDHSDYPEKPGKLRWFANIDGEEIEVEDGSMIRNKRGTAIYPKSRTFIPASVEDNPVYMETEYYQILMSLPDELRERFHEGKHKRIGTRNPFQVIPSEWVRAAMNRWKGNKPLYEDDNERITVPQSALGVDPSRGGGDFTIIAKRYDNWIDKLVKHKGEDTADGPKVAALVMNEIEGDPDINVDVIGIGSSVYDHLNGSEYNYNVVPVNVAEKSLKRDKTKKFGFANLRSELWWKMRERLDPDSGEDIQLPPDKELRIQLVTPHYKPTARGIQVESKDDIKKRIGRSTDEADAVIMSFMRKSKPGVLV